MRKLLISLGLLVLILISIPALVGQYLKYRLLNELASATWPKGYHVVLNSYNAGWFNSQAKLTVGINNSALPTANADQQHQIIMNLNIFHGPITYTKNLQGMPQLFAGLGVVTGNAKIMDLPLQIYAKVKFNMDIEMNASANQYQHKTDTNNVNLSISNLNTQLLITNHFSVLSGNSAISDFSVVDPESKLFVPTVSTTFNLTKDPSGIWVGQKYNTVPTVSYYQNNQNLLNLSGLTLNANTQVNNNQFSSQITAQVQKVMPQNYEIFGPVSLSFSMKNVNAKTMNDFNRFLSNTDFSDKNLTTTQTNQINNQLFLYLIKLAQGSALSIDQLSMSTPRGNVSLVASVNFPAVNVDVNQPSNPIVVSDLAMQLTSQSQASLQAMVPVQFIVDTMNKLMPNNQEWMQYLTIMNSAGVVKSDGLNLSTDIRYSPNNATINGAPLQTVVAQFQALLQQMKEQPAAATSAPASSNGTSSVPAAAGTPGATPAINPATPGATPVINSAPASAVTKPDATPVINPVPATGGSPAAIPPVNPAPAAVGGTPGATPAINPVPAVGGTPGTTPPVNPAPAATPTPAAAPAVNSAPAVTPPINKPAVAPAN